MIMLKKIIVIITALAGMLGAVSCADISLSTKTGSGYNFVVTNGTGGVLESIVIDSTTCNDVQPGATCEVLYNARPVEKEVAYTGKKASGYGEAISDTVTVTTVAGSESHNHDLVLGSDYVAVWVENVSETTGQDIDLVGIGDGETISATGDLTSVAEYQGVTGEAIAYTNLDDIDGSINSTDSGYFSIYARVTGEQVTHDVSGEDPSDGTLDFNLYSTVVAVILKKSVVLYDDQTGTPTEIARDDGNGKFVSAEGILDTGASNTINYDTGALSYTFDAAYDTPGTITVGYRGVTGWEWPLENTPVQGSIVVKMGDQVVAQEVYDTDDEKYTLSGDLIISNMSEYDYTGNTLTMLLASDAATMDVLTDHLVIEYAYLVASDDDGSGTIDGSDTRLSGQTGTIDYSTGEYTDLFLDANYFASRTAYPHTVTALYANYHAPYVKAITDNIGEAATFSGTEAITFDAATRTVEAYLANRIITAGSITIEATFDGGTVVITGDADGVLSGDTPAGDVGYIDYASGKVKFSLPDDTYRTGETLISLNATAYEYHLVTDSTNKAWAGFFEKDDIDGNGIYVLDMNGPAALDGHWLFTNFDFLYDTNSAGSTVLNLVCALQYQ